MSIRTALSAERFVLFWTRVLACFGVWKGYFDSEAHSNL